MIALIGIMAGMATWAGQQMLGDWRLKKAGQRLFEDLKAVQGRAERAGSLTLNNGALVMQRSFLVFDPAASAYAAYAWQDGNADGLADTGEATLLWQQQPPCRCFLRLGRWHRSSCLQQQQRGPGKCRFLCQSELCALS